MRLFEEYHKMIYVAEILMNKLEYEISELKIDDEHLPDILEKAYNTKMKINTSAKKWDNPPEMMELITRLNGVINKLEQKHNKYVNDM